MLQYRVADKLLTDRQFYELLDFVNFELISHRLENGIKIYFLKDLQDTNLGDIEQDIFYIKYKKTYGLVDAKKQDRDDWLCIKKMVLGRLEIYLYDYTQIVWCPHFIKPI